MQIHVASDYLVECHIPQVVKDLSEWSVERIESADITSVLHSKGTPGVTIACGNLHLWHPITAHLLYLHIYFVLCASLPPPNHCRS